MQKIFSRFVPLFTAAVIALATISPVLYSFDPPQQTSELDALFGGKILICTPTGFKYISLADYMDGDQEHSPAPHCPLCVFTNLAALHAPLTSPAKIDHPIQISAIEFQDVLLFADVFHLSYTAYPRAPPPFA